jgi:hypothetical protein
MISGMREHAEDFPAPPFGADEIEAYIDAFQQKSDAAALAQGAAAEAVDEKGEAFQTLIDSLRAVLRYAEDAVKYDSAKLKNIGWNGRKRRSELQAPGQAGILETKREGPGWIYLEWKRPTEGGRVAAYHIQILKDGEKEWQDLTTCFERMTVLTDQERGVELKYRVLTGNRTGRGVPSNVVTAVL